MEASREKHRKFFKKNNLSKSSKDGSKASSQCSTRSCTPPNHPSENIFPPAMIGNIVNNSFATSNSRRPTTSSTTTTNSSSLDEADIRMTHDRRFVTAPRRARSAERFEGIRIALSNTSSGLERDELISRNFQSPQPFTARNNGYFIPRSSDSLGSIPKAMPSPPPPYTATATALTNADKNGPPSYHQAVAMTQQAVLANENAKKQLNNRYNMTHRGTQSFETNSGLARGTLRSAASVPTFKNYNSGSACNCSKCQIQERQNMNSNEIGCGDCNDAVYMESQAFLMHEIMTDGMAFCSIM